MNFNFIRFHQSASFKIKNGPYAGAGYFIDYYFNIVDHKLDLSVPVRTSQYLYSNNYGFRLHEVCFILIECTVSEPYLLLGARFSQVLS